MIPIGIEVTTETSSIDNLFISHRGYLVLVETKLWRNPEAKREVVAQAIDYGSSLSKWTYERLNRVVRDYTKKYENVELDLLGWVEKRNEPVEGGKDFFEESVIKNLKLGRFLTVIVGDKIRQSVVEMVKHVNKYPGLAMDVALIELQCFWMKEKDNWPLLVVPRVIARTEIVERSVVQVTVNNGESPQVDVRQEKVRVESGGNKKVTLTEEAFWELLTKLAPNDYDKARHVIDEYKKREEIDVAATGSSITVRLNIQGNEQKVSLFFLKKDARWNIWPSEIRKQLIRVGYPANLVDAYDKQMRDVLRAPKKATDLSGRITEVDASLFKSVVDEFIRNVQLARPVSDFKRI